MQSNSNTQIASENLATANAALIIAETADTSTDGIILATIISESTRAANARATSETNANIATTRAQEAYNNASIAATREQEISIAEKQVLAQSLVANSWALLSNRNITDQELAQARLLAVEGVQLNQEVGRPQDQALSQELLYALTIEIPDTDQPVITSTEHTNWVLRVTWEEDDSHIASASEGGKVIIWQANENQTNNWRLTNTLINHTDDVLRVAWKEDGNYLTFVSDDKTIVAWAFPDFSVLHCSLAGRNLSFPEWEQFLPNEPYRCTCEQWSAGEGAPADAAGCQP